MPNQAILNRPFLTDSTDLIGSVFLTRQRLRHAVIARAVSANRGNVRAVRPSVTCTVEFVIGFRHDADVKRCCCDVLNMQLLGK